MQRRPADAPELHDFVRKRSQLVLNLHKIYTEWLGMPNQQWETNYDFQAFSAYVQNINMAKYATEQAVKDVSDFAHYCQKPSPYDNVVGVVNSHRELIDIHNLTKEEIANI